MRGGNITGGEVVTVLICVAMATTGLAQTAPFLAAVSEGLGAAGEVYAVIDRKSYIDSLDDNGLKPEHCLGEVKLHNVVFAYPNRPDAPILKGFDLHVPAGKTVALVGHSGCGKSTIVGLIERFYDVDSGVVLIDGVNVKDLSLSWLRDRVGLVSQTPTLFPFSIFDNIALGQSNITEDQVIAAAKLANAHDFIMSFPDGYKTLVGDQGKQLSGGQRQRIAIARTLVRDPNVLLLDEATSALDHHSERQVQRALNRATVGRTTIVIAHRLSTVRRADSIVVLSKSGIVEVGTHKELKAKRGIYYNMLKAHDNAASDGEDLASYVENETEKHGDGVTGIVTDEGLEISRAGPIGGEAAKATAKGGANMSEEVNGDDDDTVSSDDEGSDIDEESLSSDKEEESSSDIRPARAVGRTESVVSTGTKTSMVRAGEITDEDSGIVDVNLRRWVLKESKPDWPYFTMAVVVALVESCVWPTYGILLSQASGVIRDPNHSASAIGQYSIGLLVLGFIMIIVSVGRGFGTAVVGENLTFRKRNEVMWAVMHQTAEWHEKPEHSRSIVLHPSQ